MTKPEVSVVIAVHNGEGDLNRTLESVLQSQDVDLEIVVVDDGSIDDTPRILSAFAGREPRLRVLRQKRLGLTMALIHGCNEARGEFIARQDVGDSSSQVRIRTQLIELKADRDIAFVSCWVQFVGPQGEALYRVAPNPDGATERLRDLSGNGPVGPPHHGSTLFSKGLYDSVGGYRSEFYFAQDLDLWTRMVERGGHSVVPQILYEASLAPGSISMRHRDQQVALTRIIRNCTRLRRSDADEAIELAQAATIRPSINNKASALMKARGLYFIGSCLRKQGDPRARGYFRQALEACPFHLRSFVGWALS